MEKGAGRMSDWVHNLPFGWLAALVFGLSYVGAGMIHALVARLALASADEHSKLFPKACCRHSASSSGFSSPSLPRRSGAIQIVPTLR
jgi:hypothetical protein